MDEPYRIRTAIAPHPVSRDEVREYFERMACRQAVNPIMANPRIMKR